MHSRCKCWQQYNGLFRGQKFPQILQEKKNEGWLQSFRIESHFSKIKPLCILLCLVCILPLLLLVGYFRLMCICSLQGLCLRSSHRERFEFQGKAAKRAHWKSAGRRKVPKRRICHTFHQTGSTHNRTLLTSRFHSIRISCPIHGGNDQKRSKGTVKVPIFDKPKFQWKKIFEIVKKNKFFFSLFVCRRHQLFVYFFHDWVCKTLTKAF